MKGDPPEIPELSRAGRFDAAMAALCLILPAALAAAGAASTPTAAHDEAVVRTVGLGWAGPLRALDALVAAPVMLVPIGTRALRAGLASAVISGVASAVAYEVARRLVATVLPGLFPRAAASPKLGSAVAAVAVLGATLGPAWQGEACAPGGAVTGALLVVLALALAGRMRSTNIRPVALVLGLAASYDPFVLLGAALAAAPYFTPYLARRPGGAGKAGEAGAALLPDRRALADGAMALVLGLAPLAVGMAFTRRAPELALTGALDPPLRANLAALASAEVGTVLLAAAGAGALLAATVPGARRVLASLVGVVLAGAASVALGGPRGGAVLAAVVAALVLAAVALAAVAIAIARAPVPFAQASAALVVVLELVIPVHAADETSGRREAHAPRSASTWTEIAWGQAPTAAVVLVSDHATMRRAAASRALGELRADLVFVPMFAIRGPAARRALATEPKLAPLYRDLALGSPPEELSLAELATARPLLTSFDPRWDRSLARHLMPVGLTSHFEPEPRGPSDRKRALDVFEPSRDRLVRVATRGRDPELAEATAVPLRARAIAMAASSDRDALSRTLDALRPFTENDHVVDALVRRMVTSKGAIDVHDLAP